MYRIKPDNHFACIIIVSVLNACGGGGANTSDPGNNQTSPTPTISSLEPGVTSADPILVNIDFSESVTGLALTDITVVNGTPSNLLDLNGQQYSVDVSPNTNGTILVSIAADAAQSTAGVSSLASNNFSISFQSASVTVHYQENFNAYADGSPWPSPWVVAGGSVSVSTTIQSGQACLEGFVLTSNMDPSGRDNLVRIVNTELSVQDFEARFDIIYEDFQNQGSGFYGRQNGRFFNVDTIPGQGYGFFLKGFAADQLTFWYELLGDEIPHHEVEIESVLSVTQGQLNAASFHVAYQVEQISTTETQQRAKVWLVGDPEPSDWQIVSDEVGSELPNTNPMNIPELQNLADGFAIDLYNSSTPAIGNSTTESICVDNLLITALH